MMKPRWLPIEPFILNWWSGWIESQPAKNLMSNELSISKRVTWKRLTSLSKDIIRSSTWISWASCYWNDIRLVYYVRCFQRSVQHDTKDGSLPLDCRYRQVSQHRSKSYLCQCRLCCLFHRMTIDFIDLPRTQSIAPQSAKGVVEESLLSQPVGFFCFLVSYFFYSFYFHISCYYLSFFVLSSIFSCLSLSFS